VASKSLVEWLKMLWENWGTSAWCVVLFCLVLCPDLFFLSGHGGGVRLPFIGQGESESHVCHATWLRGEVWCAML
jgi:hypothetical protein